MGCGCLWREEENGLRRRSGIHSIISAIATDGQVDVLQRHTLLGFIQMQDPCWERSNKDGDQRDRLSVLSTRGPKHRTRIGMVVKGMFEMKYLGQERGFLSAHGLADSSLGLFSLMPAQQVLMPQYTMLPGTSECCCHIPGYFPWWYLFLAGLHCCHWWVHGLQGRSNGLQGRSSVIQRGSLFKGPWQGVSPLLLARAQQLYFAGFSQCS